MKPGVSDSLTLWQGVPGGHPPGSWPCTAVALYKLPGEDRMKTRILRVAVLLAAVLLPACGWGERSGAEDLAVEGAWARPMSVVEGGPSPSGVHSAVYLTLRNGGRGSERLLGGETEVAEVLEIHESRMEDGIMRMRPVEGGIRIPAGSVAELRPGGLHLMLLNLRASLVEGDTLVLSLQFEESGTREILVPVRPVGER